MEEHEAFFEIDGVDILSTVEEAFYVVDSFSDQQWANNLPDDEEARKEIFLSTYSEGQAMRAVQRYSYAILK